MKVFAITRKRTALELADAFEDSGRRRGQLAGTHIDNLAAARKAIWLCDDCLPKFNAQAYGYIYKLLGINRLPFVRGRCDGCNNHFSQMCMTVHHTHKME